MIQFALAAGKMALGFLGNRQQQKAAKAKAEYDARVIEARGQQALYDAQTHATMAEFNRQREVMDSSYDERSLQRDHKKAQSDLRASYISRGIDPSAAVMSLAVEKERAFQEIGYRSGKIQANLVQEARLSTFYGQIAKQNSVYEAALTRAEGAARASAIKKQGMINLVTDAIGIGKDFGSDISSAFGSMFGGGSSESSGGYSLYKGNTSDLMLGVKREPRF